MRTAPAVDRSKVVLATGFGLIWRILAFFFAFCAVIVFIGLLVNYFWVVVAVLVGIWAVYMVRTAPRRRMIRDSRESRRRQHIAKYGREPKPW